MIARSEGSTYYAQSKDSGRGRLSHSTGDRSTGEHSTEDYSTEDSHTEDAPDELSRLSLARDLAQDPTPAGDEHDDDDLLSYTDIDDLDEEVLGGDGIDLNDHDAEVFTGDTSDSQDSLTEADGDFYYSKAMAHGLLTSEQETDIGQRRDKAFDKFLHSLYSCEIAVDACVTAVKCSLERKGGTGLTELLDLRLLGMKSLQARRHCERLLPNIAELREKAASLYADAIATDPSGLETTPAWATLKEVRVAISTLVKALGVRGEFAQAYLEKVAQYDQMVNKPDKPPPDGDKHGSGSRNGSRKEISPDLSQLLREAQETPTSLEAAAKETKRCFDEYINVRNEFVVANLRLAWRWAYRYLNRGIAFDDLIQEANQGLIAAAEKFDPSFKSKFSTYAVPWIKQKLVNSTADHGQTIRVPAYLREQLSVIRWSRKQLFSELGHAPQAEEIAARATALLKESLERKLSKILRTQLGCDPTPEDIAERLKSTKQTIISAEDVVLALRAAANPLSLDQSRLFDDGAADTLAAELPDPRLGPVEEQLVLRQRQLEGSLPGLLKDTLDHRELIIVEMRYGLGTDRQEYTLAEVGEVLEITRERVRQIEKNALEKLRALADLPELRALE